MSKGVSINWDHEWISDKFNEVSTLQELTDRYNEEHGTDIGYRTLKGYCQRNGYYKCNLTDEQDKFIREMYPKHGSKKTCDLFNTRFKTNKTWKQIRGLACNRKLRILSHDTYVECRKNHKKKYDIGDYISDWTEHYVKVAEGKFEKASTYNYKKYKGDIPEGYRVIHLDGDILNNDPENLECVSANHCMRMARNNLYSKYPALTKGALMLLELEDRIRD